jgi:phosphoribosylformimino-5-aminoimidazole carboxamide ribotide isomerase
VQLFPAIDIREGRSVRLRHGDFTQETIYSDDPRAVARGYVESGAEWIHLVDLDAARTGDPVNRDVIAAICADVPCAVQVGGGIRSREVAHAFLDFGAARVVIGTAAVMEPEWVAALCATDPDRVAVALDARGTAIAVNGWGADAGVDLLEQAAQWSDAGAAALVVTEIGRDGTLDGPDLGQLGSVLAVAEVPVIASGGVGSLDDLSRLRELAVADRHLSGVIVGRALADQRFALADALAVVR